MTSLKIVLLSLIIISTLSQPQAPPLSNQIQPGLQPQQQIPQPQPKVVQPIQGPPPTIQQQGNATLTPTANLKPSVHQPDVASNAQPTPPTQATKSGPQNVPPPSQPSLNVTISKQQAIKPIKPAPQTVHPTNKQPVTTVNKQQPQKVDTKPQNTPQSSQQQQQVDQRTLQQLTKSQQQQVKYAQSAKYTQTLYRQRQQARAVQAAQDYTIPKKTVLFEVHKAVEQFRINPTIDHLVIISIVVYIQQDNVYGLIKNLQSTSPLKIYVYEDNVRIIGHGEFYFQKALRFTVKAKSNYTIKFYNQRVDKLVSFTYPNLIQSSHIQDLYHKQKGQYHLHKIRVLGVKMEQITERLRRNSLLDKINNENIIMFLKNYFGYQFVEMMIVLAVCALQVHLVKKLFKSDSIL